MASKEGILEVYVRFILICILVSPIFAQYNIAYQTPADCKKSDADEFHEFFDISQLQCTRCAQNNEFQTVSSDGLRCICQPGMRIERDFGGVRIECRPCPDGQMASQDGWECVKCGAVSADPNTICVSCNANNKEISVERELNGSWSSMIPAQKCVKCASETKPDSSGLQCERCNQILSVLPSATDCICPPDNQAGGMCFESSDDIDFETSQLFRVTFGEESFDSAFFYENAEAAAGMCGPKYTNLTGCQLLGHMCVMLMYSRRRLNVAASDTCTLYDDLLEESKGFKRNDYWPPNMPWLYYFEDADRILTDTTIPTQFKFPNMEIPLKAAKFTANGTFLGYFDVSSGLLQMCKNSRNILDAAYIFGTTYEQKCEIAVSDLFDMANEEMLFYDLYLEYTDNNQKQLYAVPALIRNYVDQNGRRINEGENREEWQLVRRFFLVDTLSGLKESSSVDPSGATLTTKSLRAVRYASFIKLHFELQEDSTSGLIYPPYIEIQYSHTTSEDVEADRKVGVQFEVGYKMSLGKYNRDMSIAMGVLSSLGFIYAFFLTWAWSRRAGKIAIDFVTLIKFVLHLCGSLANVFFVVIFGASLWWWIFYKRQSNVYLIVPDDDQNRQFVAYLGAAFALKFIHLIHMIISQVTVDLFFIDWERPQGGTFQSGEKTKESSVSIWRTYFVANEWNEIQTCRKINPLFQIFAVLLMLEVVGFGNLATRDPLSSFSLSPTSYHSPPSQTFRFCIIALTYLVIALIQWLFHTFIYERFVEDKVRQYVDLCSMSNISVFILENEMFGYYIHGRSVHGRADTGMREMHENLKREEEDLCGQRGLLPNTEQQTFQMAIPRKLRHQYDRVIQPIQNPGQGAGNAGRTGGRGSHIDPQVQKSIHAYGILNRFLQSFVDHSLRDIDYIIKDKVLLENIMNMEFTDPTDHGFLYNDSGHSFDAVLFFGNETTLTIFEILFFSIVDLIFQSYTLAAILTYLLMQVVYMIRDSLGQRNLARKTLVDDRFLI